jgi:hypothetical protein
VADKPTLEQKLKILVRNCVTREGKYLKRNQYWVPYCTLFPPTKQYEPYHCHYLHQEQVLVAKPSGIKLNFWYCGKPINEQREEEWKN